MHLPITLLRQPKHRHFALLDEQRLCRMLLTAQEQPPGERWVEVPAIRPEWIGKPVPGGVIS